MFLLSLVSLLFLLSYVHKYYYFYKLYIVCIRYYKKFDIHWHDGGPSIAMMYHLRRVSDLLCNWKSCLPCYMKDVVLHCSIFLKWNNLVRVRVRVRVSSMFEQNMDFVTTRNYMQTQPFLQHSNEDINHKLHIYRRLVLTVFFISKQTL